MAHTAALRVGLSGASFLEKEVVKKFSRTFNKRS
jgi:hypothetical protein